ncbi:MAG: rod shape-determining protein MreC [Nitrospirae bacterium]|nr:rod shape-determining protein MreC [Nitrospirota bacterium]
MFRYLTLNKKILIAFILIIGIFVLLSPEIKQRPAYSLIERPFLTIAGIIQSGLANISGGISSTWRGYINLINVQKDNEILSKELTRLRSEAIFLREKAATGDRLTALLEIENRYVVKQAVAGIIAKDPANWYEALVIDKGDRDGIKPGMGVITAEGVIGRVTKTAPGYSRVLLLSDRNSAVAGQIQRTGYEGIVEGQQGKVLRLNYIMTDADVQNGDIIITSGMDGVFPQGIIIGRITRVEKPQNRLFQSVELIPEVNLSLVKEVMVIKPPVSSEVYRLLQGEKGE